MPRAIVVKHEDGPQPFTTDEAKMAAALEHYDNWKKSHSAVDHFFVISADQRLDFKKMRKTDFDEKSKGEPIEVQDSDAKPTLKKKSTVCALPHERKPTCDDPTSAAHR